MTGQREASAARGGAGTYRRVVVGVDDSAGGLAALQRAVSMARSGGVQLVAVRCWDIGLPRHGGRRHRHRSHNTVMLVYNGVQQRMASDNLIHDAFQAATGGAPDDVTMTIRTPQGEPGLTLTGIARANGDVLVVGTMPGYRAKRLVHGSVSRYCSKHAQCPVVVVPALAPGTEIPETGPRGAAGLGTA
jgi:nucleotide-binding universal stress UspA family protein